VGTPETVFLGLIALASVVQAGVLVALLLALGRASERLERTSARIEAALLPLLSKRGAGIAARADVAALRAALTTLLRAERIEPRVPEHAAPDPSLEHKATLYHLIDRGSADAYRERAERAAGSLASTKIRVTGPFPAYAFAPLP